jgi:hypothetical protein
MISPDSAATTLPNCGNSIQDHPIAPFGRTLADSQGLLVARMT